MAAEREAVERFKEVLRRRMPRDRQHLGAICWSDRGMVDRVIAVALRELADEFDPETNEERAGM